MAMKVAEFMKLAQGTRSMTEYLHAFNNLSRYASDFVNTEEKKIASFKRGLNPKMLKSMGNSARITFNDFVSDCLTQENHNNLYTASKNRKRVFESGPSQVRVPTANRPSYRPPAPGAKFRPPQKRFQNTQQQQKVPRPFKMATPQAKAGPGSSSGAPTVVRGPCYNCNQPGHFAKYCPYPQKKQNTYQARVHYTTMEDIPEGEPVTAGMFSINQHHAVVLFDSGSSHSFISQAFIRKHDQKIKEYGYRISWAGADLLTNQMVQGATLNIAGR
jgi:hypothetical protein